MIDGTICGNGVLENGEQCDDGNYRSGDGCSNECDTESGFLCQNVTVASGGGDFIITQCCKALLNPVTNASTCSCVGQDSGSLFYSITQDCVKVDIDECVVANGGCAFNAVCINLDGTVSNSGGRKCICPEGLYGDGLERCDQFRYGVALTLSVKNITEVGNFLSISWIVDKVTESTFFNSSSILSISAMYLSHARHLLDTEYDHFTISLEVATWDTMQELVDEVNAELIAQYLSNETDGLNQITVLQEAVTVVDESPRSYLYAEKNTPAFFILNITYQSFYNQQYVPISDHAWEILLHTYTPSDVYSVLFLTKNFTGEAPTSHACVENPDVCCLHRMLERHYMGDFGSLVSSRVSPYCTDNGGFPNSSALSLPSETIIGELGTQEWFTGLFPFSNISTAEKFPVFSTLENFRLLLAQTDIENYFSQSSSFNNGTTYTFSVGMLFFKPLSVPSLYTAVSQAQIQLFTSNTLTFVSSGQHAYSFLESLDMTAYEIEYRPTVQVLHSLQYLQVVFTVPDYIYDVTVAIDSLQFTIETNIGNIANWTNPCYSNSNESLRDNSGLWDDDDGIKATYADADAQDCARRDSSYCNTTMLTAGAYTIDVPLGDKTLTNAILTSTTQHYVFLRMLVLGTQNNSGDVVQVMTQVNAQLLVDEASVLKVCNDAISSLLSETEYTSVSVAIGVRLDPIDNDVRDAIVFTDVMNSIDYTTLKALDTSEAYQAVSVIDSIMTLIIQGEFNYFEQYEHLSYTVFYDHVMTIHLRNDEKYLQIKELIANGTAFTTIKNNQNKYEIVLSQATSQSCYGASLLPDPNPDSNIDCVVQHPVHNRIVYAPQAHIVGNSVETNIVWFLQQFGDTTFMRSTAQRFSTQTMNRFGLNYRYKKALWLTPGYQWPTKTAIGVIDRTIVLMAYAVDK